MPHGPTTDPTRTESLRQGWRRDKRAQRARKKPKPLPLCPVFREAVLDERDRRARSAYHARRMVNGIYVEVAKRLPHFAADVWAARTMLRAEWGKPGDSPSRIARWLWEEGRTNYYAQSSIRPRVYAAIKIIADLESHGPTHADPPFWLPWEHRFDRDSIVVHRGPRHAADQIHT